MKKLGTTWSTALQSMMVAAAVVVPVLAACSGADGASSSSGDTNSSSGGTSSSSGGTSSGGTSSGGTSSSGTSSGGTSSGGSSSGGIDGGSDATASPTCSDGTKNGSETDVDCGGTCPTKCEDTKKCSVAADCASGVCDGTAKTCTAIACTDSVMNGSETDVDCGGTCPTKCEDMKKCSVAADCASGVCDETAKTCTAASCNDTVKNGTETDVDCGGTCAAKCAENNMCVLGSDCVFGVCSLGLCNGPTCTDGLQNGSETDVDCGGTCPTKCAVTKKCSVPADCASFLCNSGFCSSIVTDGLVLHLDAANPRSYPGTGVTWTDLSGNGTQGTLVNGPSFSSAGGGSLVFDGIDDYVSLPSSAPYRFTNTQPFSISAWVNFTAPSGGAAVFAFALTVGRGYYLQLDKSVYRTNSFFFDYWDGGPFRGIQGNSDSIATSAWVNLVATSSSNSVIDMKMYQNGVLTSWTNRGTGTPTSVDYSTVPMQIGARGSSGYFTGNIAQVSVYNRALTAGEVQQNFEAARGRYGL